MDALVGVRDHRVPGRVAHDVERLQDRDARLHQRAERARRAPDRRLADELAEAGDLELDPVEEQVAPLRLVDHPAEEDQHHDAHGERDRVVDEVVSDVDDEPRHGRHLRVLAQHVDEELLELRDDRDHHEAREAERDAEDNDRVGHRRLHLALDLLRLLEELREARERDLERAGGLAGLRHVHVQVVEDLRVLRERVRERRAALDRLAHPLQDALQARHGALLREDAQAAQQREARLHERRELAREDHQVLRPDALGDEELRQLDLDVQGALLLLAALGDEGLRREVVLAQDELRLGHVLRLDDAALLVAGGVLGHVVEPLHGDFSGGGWKTGAGFANAPDCSTARPCAQPPRAARAKSRGIRLCSARLGAAGGLRRGGVLGPDMARVAAAQLLADERIALAPEGGEVGGDLHRPMRRREQL